MRAKSYKTIDLLRDGAEGQTLRLIEMLYPEN